MVTWSKWVKVSVQSFGIPISTLFRAAEGPAANFRSTTACRLVVSLSWSGGRHPLPVLVVLVVCGLMLFSSGGLPRVSGVVSTILPGPLSGSPAITVHHTPGSSSVWLTGSGFQDNGVVHISAYNATAPTWLLRNNQVSTNATGDFNSSANPTHMSEFGNGTYVFRVNDSAVPQNVATTAWEQINGTYELSLSANLALPGTTLNATGYNFAYPGTAYLYLGNLTGNLEVNSSITVTTPTTSFTDANFTIPPNAGDGNYVVIGEDAYGDLAFAFLVVGSAATEIDVTFISAPNTCEIQFGTAVGNPQTYANGSSTGPIAAGVYAISPASCTGEVLSSWSWSGPTGSVTDPTAAQTTLDATSNGTLTATFAASELYMVTLATTPTTCSIDFNGLTYTTGESTDVTNGTYAISAPTCAGETFDSWSSSVGSVTAPASSTTTVDVDASGTLAALYSTYVPQNYTVTLDETGLPVGVAWTLMLDGATYTTTLLPEINFTSPNEGYSVGIPGANGASVVYIPTVPSQSPNFILEGASECPGLPATNSLCAQLIVAGANLTIQVIFTGAWQLNWVPSRDSYNFNNPTSPYATIGNCYGISETEVLYWYHDVLGDSSYPYLPLQTGGAVDTHNLTWDPTAVNSPTLAISIHQAMDPDNAGAVGVLRSPAFNQQSQFLALQHDVEDLGQPTVLAMGEPHASGVQSGYHAVVVYGMTTLTNGTTELNISDPNAPGVGTHGWYYSYGSTFVYNEFFQFRQFAVATLHPLDSSYLNGTSLFTNFDSTLYPDVFVLSDGPVAILSPPPATTLLFSVDSFGDNGGGDSQTFQQGIEGSSGIEEGAIQAYGIPVGAPISIDPPVAKSTELLVRSVNESGTNILYGMRMGTATPGSGTYNITPNANGFNLTSPVAFTLANVSFFYRNDPTSTSLTAYDLSFAAGDTERFIVNNWSALNTSGVESVTLEVFTAGATSPSGTYGLVNGQHGLPMLSPKTTPGPNLVLPFYVGIGVAIVVVVVAVAVYYRRRGKKSEP
jgi:hypothetical protein